MRLASRARPSVVSVSDDVHNTSYRTNILSDKHKHERLRRSASKSTWARPEKPARIRHSKARGTPKDHSIAVKRPIKYEREDSLDSLSAMSALAPLTPSFTGSPYPPQRGSYVANSIENSNEPLDAQKLQAELETAEAELKVARLRLQYIEAKEKQERANGDTNYDGPGSVEAPYVLG